MTHNELKIKTKETSNKKNQKDEIDSYGALVRDAGYWFCNYICIFKIHLNIYIVLTLIICELNLYYLKNDL